MAWNDNKNPWGDKQNSTPPELDEVIKDFKNKFGGIFGGGKPPGGSEKVVQIPSPKGGFKYLILVALLVWLGFGVYTIDPAEKGVVLRFGAFQEETNPGLHWHLPFPIETLTKINVEQIRTAEIGFRNVVNNNRRFGGNVSSESIMLTKDENMIDAKFAVQYKVNDAQNYLFSVVDPDVTLRHAVESSIRQVVGQNTLDYILTDGRVDVAEKTRERSQKLLDEYQTGLTITSVNMQDAQPPEQVQAAFSDAVKAREDRERLINEAEAYANDIIPRARGAAARTVEEARAYKDQVIAKSEGEADRFDKLLVEYERAPEVTKERLYRETLESVLGSTSKVVVDSNSNSMMYLPIDKLVGAAKESQTTINVTPNPQNNSSSSQSNGVRNIFRTREVR
jgi:membrane protease subunit HflK